MRIVGILAGSGEFEVFPVADAGHQLHLKQVGHAEDGRTLRLRIPVQDLRAGFLVLLLKDIQDEGPFPHAAGNEVTEAGNVIVRHMIVANTPVPVNLGIKLLEFRQLSWLERFSSSSFSSQFLGTG